MYIRKLDSGAYQVLVKHAGRRRSATAATRAEATQLGAELLLELGGSPRSAATVADLLAGHLADVRGEWSPTTYADARRVVAKLPVDFKQRRVRDVSPAVIAGLYRQLRADGMSPHRLRRVRMVLNGAWKRAISYEWASSNPCRDVELPKVERPEIRPSTDADVQRAARLTRYASSSNGVADRVAAISFLICSRSRRASWSSRPVSSASRPASSASSAWRMTVRRRDATAAMVRVARPSSA